MTPLLNELNLGAAQVVHVLNARASFKSELAELHGIEIKRTGESETCFALAFVKTLAEIESASEQLTRNAVGDAVL